MYTYARARRVGRTCLYLRASFKSHSGQLVALSNGCGDTDNRNGMSSCRVLGSVRLPQSDHIGAKWGAWQEV